MKILVVLYKFGTIEEIGKNLGSYDYFLNQLIQLQKRGVEVNVLAPWVKWTKKGSTQIEGINIIRYWPKLATRSWRNLLSYKIINKFYIWLTGYLAKKYIKKLNIDVVYVRQARETGHAIAKIRSKINTPIVFQPITTWRWHFDEAGDTFLKKIVKDIASQRKYADNILQTFDYFVTYNHAMKEEYASMGSDINKYNIIPGAVKHEIFKPLGDKTALRKELDLPVDKKLVLNIGPINIKEKGTNYLLEGFRKVVDSDEDSRLILIGPGTPEQISKLNQKIDELKLQNYVLYLGSKDYNSLPRYINACDIGVMASIWFESFGRTTLDMISCGLPVITTKVGGLSETNIDNETGLNVEPKNSQAMADAIIELISNDDLRKKMGENARLRTLNVYTLQKTTDQFIEFFTKIIK